MKLAFWMIHGSRIPDPTKWAFRLVFAWNSYRFPLPKNIETTTLPPKKTQKQHLQSFLQLLPVFSTVIFGNFPNLHVGGSPGGSVKKPAMEPHLVVPSLHPKKISAIQKQNDFNENERETLKNTCQTFSSISQCITSWWFQPIWFFFSQIGSFPPLGVRIKNVWNHHLDHLVPA